ncbi:unnamed protein product [Cyclocybe aegerita]|uniref:Uncharacterized protein n=1 Tax=Cyclocybe aegerita TaxID=1973307 RepID=A0A8S0WBK1_CYCAE|nr:unnamed protein product [Cyclocybe aegerita]
MPKLRVRHGHCFLFRIQLCGVPKGSNAHNNPIRNGLPQLYLRPYRHTSPSFLRHPQLRTMPEWTDSNHHPKRNRLPIMHLPPPETDLLLPDLQLRPMPDEPSPDVDPGWDLVPLLRLRTAKDGPSTRLLPYA